MSERSEGTIDALVEVRIVEMDLDVYRRTQAHHDELFREFALIAGGSDDGTTTPKKLLALVEELNARFASFTAGPNDLLAEAAARGDERIDLDFAIPPAARDAVVRLQRLLDEADEYCRAGELLTLATPAEAVEFRNWYLDEFVRQIDGEPPRPWPEARGSGA